MTTKLDHVLNAIDAANRADPNTHKDTTGASQPEAYLYGLRMTSELERLFGQEASDVLRIAARGQHIERWQSRRDTYPPGRTGYLRWRQDQGKAHGARLGEIMAASGYDREDCARVGVLLRKEGLKRDAEVQRLEDVICLTFLKWYFEPFAAKHTREKVRDIVAKTARKMSPEARQRVLSEFDLPETLIAAVTSAT